MSGSSCSRSPLWEATCCHQPIPGFGFFFHSRDDVGWKSPSRSWGPTTDPPHVPENLSVCPAPPGTATPPVPWAARSTAPRPCATGFPWSQSRAHQVGHTCPAEQPLALRGFLSLPPRPRWAVRFQLRGERVSAPGKVPARCSAVLALLFCAAPTRF